MAAELGTLRLRAGDNYVVARAQDNGTYELEVSDHVGGPVSDVDRLVGLKRMMEEVSELRSQLWREVNQLLNSKKL